MSSQVELALRAAADEGLEANARRWFRFFGWQPGDHVEIQAINLGGRQFVAHAPDIDTFVRLLSLVDQNPNKAEGTYVIVNHVSDAVAQREPVGEWRLAKLGSTSDRDITHRAALYIDVDVVRPTHTSSTDAELAQACEMAARIYADLVKYIGGYDAVAVGLSGNGCAIFVALDRLEETPALRALISETLRALQRTYESASIKVDAHLFDAKRLVPAFGTLKCKGPGGDLVRPHRRTSILVTDSVRRLSIVELARLRDEFVTRAPAPVPVLPPAEVDGASDDDDAAGGELSDFRARIVKLRRHKASSENLEDRERYRIYGALLDGTALALSPSEVLAGRVDLPAGRAKTVNRVASMLAFALPVGTVWEAAVEVLRPSLAATDCEPEGVQHWLTMAEISYNRAMDRALQHARERDERQQNEALVRQALTEVVVPAVVVPAAAAAAVTPAADLHGFLGVLAKLTSSTAQVSTTGDDWMRHLIPSADNKVVSCPHNVYVILAHCPAIAGTIRFNVVTKDIEVCGGPFQGMDPETLSTALMNWLHASQWRIKVKRTEVEDQLLLVAMEHKFDPIVDMLTGLKWDEKSRLDDFFFTHAVARQKGAGGQDLTNHLRRVGSKFFISGAARAINPGCQVDTMLVLEGTKEGEGKTEMCRRLFHPWYAVTRGINDKDALMLTATTWGIELGELSAAKRSEDEHWLSYLDTRDDKYRPPYGRRHVTAPRRCVFVGTTNKEQWLTPGKGRRRYWPVFIEKINLDLIDQDRDQLWAEAVVRLRNKERWHLTDAERAEADSEASARVEESYIESRVSAWWYNMQPKSRPTFVTLLDVIENALKLQPGDAARSKTLQVDIGFAMQRLGFAKSRPSVNGQRSYGWVPTESMLSEKQVPGYMRLVNTTDDGIEAIASATAGRVQ